MTILTLKAKHDHLKKVASTRDHVKALSEFVWNALDADATKTSVEFVRNSLGGLQSIRIRDDGTGIPKARADHDFESLGESWKLKTNRTALHRRVIHGKEGKGRLRFFALAQKARWTSVYKEGAALLQLVIDIDGDRLETSNVSDPEAAPPDATTGTVVELEPLKETFDWLTSEAARADFSSTFAPYILQYPRTVISYDGKPVDPRATIEREHPFETKPIICPDRVVRDMSLRVIEWKSGVGSRKIRSWFSSRQCSCAWI